MPLTYPQLGTLSLKALLFLRQNFDGIKRNYGGTLIEHSWRVAESIHDLIGTPERLIPDNVIASALLHDTVEFGKQGTARTIMKNIDGLVEQRVYLLSKPGGGNEEEQFDLRLKRICDSKDSWVKVISWADRRDGLALATSHFLENGDPDSLYNYISLSGRMHQALREQNVEGIEYLALRISLCKMEVANPSILA